MKSEWSTQENREKYSDRKTIAVSFHKELVKLAEKSTGALLVFTGESALITTKFGVSESEKKFPRRNTAAIPIPLQSSTEALTQ